MRTMTIAAGALLLLLAIGNAGEQKAQPAGTADKNQSIRKQTTCPIMGGQISTNQFADFDGKRVYFCCAGCPAEFKKDPAKYIKKLEADGITLGKTPAANPTK